MSEIKQQVAEIQNFARELERLTTGSVSRLAYSLRQECDDLTQALEEMERLNNKGEPTHSKYYVMFEGMIDGQYVQDSVHNSLKKARERADEVLQRYPRERVKINCISKKVVYRSWKENQ